MASDPPLFHWADYLTFSLSLLLSVAVGVYHGFIKKQDANMEQYILGSRDMGVIPVSVSLFVSYISAISFLADPVEVYFYGSVYWYLALGIGLGLLPVALYYAPRYHGMTFISACEFLEEMYNKPFRVCGAFEGVLMWIPFVSLMLFAPCLALEQVTGLDTEILIAITGVVCIFYSVAGGMRAVVWADTLQMVILTFGYLAMVIGGLVHIGGFGVMWDRAQAGERINFNSFDPNPTTRSTFWTYTIGGFCRIMFPYIAIQTYIQRYLAVRTPKDARNVVLINIPVGMIIILILGITGLIIFAYFGDCDPLVTGKVTRSDQMVPLMVMEVLGFLRGVPGLFMAGVMSAALSSLSSSYNAMSATLTRDVFQQIYEWKYKKPIPEKLATRTAQILTLVVGIVVMGFAMVMKHISSNLFTIGIILSSLVIGPQAANFFLALMLPWVDWISVVCGLVVGSVIPSWIAYAAFVEDAPVPRLPLYTCGCPPPPAPGGTANVTMPSVTGDAAAAMAGQSGFDMTYAGGWQPFYEICTHRYTPPESDGFDEYDLYRLSPLYYSLLAFILVIGVALICYPVVKLLRKWCTRNQYGMKSESKQKIYRNDEIETKLHKNSDVSAEDVNYGSEGPYIVTNDETGDLKVSNGHI